MHRHIVDRMDLQVTRQHLVGVGPDLHFVNVREEARLLDFLHQVDRVDGNQYWLLLVAIDNTRNTSGAAYSTSGPLAGPIAKLRI